MAKVRDNNPLAPKIGGKLNRKDDRIYRTNNGVQEVYVPSPKSAPDSKAQKANRKMFGKVMAIVNILMANPDEAKAAEKRIDAYNRSINVNVPNAPKRFKTVRSFLFHEVSTQLSQQAAAKRRKTDNIVVLPRGVKLHVNHFTELTPAELYEILKARYAVFTLEQHIIYLDEDNIDYNATHICLRRKAQVIAYARLFHHPDDPQTTLRIGRMLTVDRGKGFGRYLMQQLIEQTKQQGATTLLLHAQLHAVPFYEHFGFKTAGDMFLEAGIQHICMKREL